MFLYLGPVCYMCAAGPLDVDGPAGVVGAVGDDGAGVAAGAVEAAQRGADEAALPGYKKIKVKV